MNGWKTWAGVGMLVVGAGLHAMGMTDASNIAYGLAVPMVAVGIGHKLDKVGDLLRMVASGATSLADQTDKVSQGANAPPPAA